MTEHEGWAIAPTHISRIKPGDTVMLNGSLKTVTQAALKIGFMGCTLWGDSYCLGARPVQRALPPTKQGKQGKQ